MLHVHNRYVQQYKQVCQLSPAEVPQYDLVLLASGTPDNLPTANEVAGVMPGGLVVARGGGRTAQHALCVVLVPTAGPGVQLGCSSATHTSQTVTSPALTLRHVPLRCAPVFRRWRPANSRQARDGHQSDRGPRVPG